MSSRFKSFFRQLTILGCGVFCVLAMTGCAGFLADKKGRGDDGSPEAALGYYQSLARMTPAELGRERTVLVALPQTPWTQIRLALLVGHPRVQQDLPKGLSLLDSILKSPDQQASTFHPLARQIADNYLERIKLENQLERQAQQLNQQLKDSQRKAAELQEKLDSLAEIERTLTPRPRAVRTDGGKR